MEEKYTYYKMFLKTPYSIPSVCMSVFMQVPYCFNYYCFVKHFEIKKCDAPSLVLKIA